MVEIQSAQLVAQALGTAATQSPQPAAATVDASQAARFRSLLESGESLTPDATPATAAEPQDAATTQSLSASQGVASSQHGSAAAKSADALQPPTLGDSILHGLDKVRANLNEQWATVHSLVDPAAGPVSTASLLRFQMSMLHMGAEYQLISSVASKSAQDIDQLVKMQ